MIDQYSLNWAFLLPWDKKRPQLKDTLMALHKDVKGWLGDGTTTSGGTHTASYTHFLSSRKKGHYPEEEMVSHCYDWSHGKVQGGRSVTFIVKLIIPQKKIPLPCSHVLSSPAVMWRKPSNARRDRLGSPGSGKPSKKCWTHTICSVTTICYSGKMHNCATRKEQLKTERNRKCLNWVVQQLLYGVLANQIKHNDNEENCQINKNITKLMRRSQRQLARGLEGYSGPD